MQKIMFNDKYLLTKAVLEGLKTQTRRIVEVDNDVLEAFKQEYYTATLDYLEGLDLVQAYFLNNPQKVPYKVGEVVAIAQAYNDFYDDGCNPTIFPNGAGWTNKMFVKPSLMPHQIQITNVRIERLQDISDDDCIKEGIEKFDAFGEPASYIFFDSKTNKTLPKGWCTSPRKAYADLIDRVGKKGTWESNPYVFVYDFKLIK